MYCLKMYKYWHLQKRAYPLSTHLYDQVYIWGPANELAELYFFGLSVRLDVCPSVPASICLSSAVVITLT